MVKKLDETDIANELSGASKFFQDPERKSGDPPTKDKPNDRTVTPNGSPERLHRSSPESDHSVSPTVSAELTEGVPEEETRVTERYSFEIYSDQRRRLLDVQARYQIQTGKKLSASRIIREALEEYLKQLEMQLESKT